MAVGTTLGYTYSELRKQPNLSNSSNTSNSKISNSPDTNKNTSNKELLDTLKYIASDTTNPIVPFSSDIVIYNSHPNENYPSGIKVTDVGALLNAKLIKEGLNSSFIKCDPSTEYVKSYQISHDLIMKDVKDYSNTILLDIHRDETPLSKSDTKEISFLISKKSPQYEAHKKFIDNLVANIKNSSTVSPVIVSYNYAISSFNQDLSNNSALIEIGNNMSSDSTIEDCIDALALALENIQKVSSN